MPDRQGGHRPDWSFRAKSGRHDGCSPDEVELRLERTGARCRAVADDALTPVRRLIGDFHHGRFAPAFPPEQRATVDEAALATGRLCGPPPPTLPGPEPSLYRRST